MAADSGETEAEREQAQTRDQYGLSTNLVGQAACDAAGNGRDHHHHGEKTTRRNFRE